MAADDRLPAGADRPAARTCLAGAPARNCKLAGTKEGQERRSGGRCCRPAMVLAWPGSAQAQADGELTSSQAVASEYAGSGDDFALRVLEETRLAYLVTGNSEQDEMSRAGLWGLSQMLMRRTTIEPAEPIGVRPGQDELAFFPLIYWPVF